MTAARSLFPQRCVCASELPPGRYEQQLADRLRRGCLRQSIQPTAILPTRLRFEDYIYRLWIHQSKIVSAHVDAAQRHMKNNYMRKSAGNGSVQ